MDPGSETDGIREAVAVFATAETLQDAIDHARRDGTLRGDAGTAAATCRGDQGWGMRAPMGRSPRMARVHPPPRGGLPRDSPAKVTL